MGIRSVLGMVQKFVPVTFINNSGAGVMQPRFDSDGNMVNWWTDKDAEEYTKRTNVIRDQYAAYEVEGEKVNGELTLGENIADIGGLLIAYHAFSMRKELDGTSPNGFSETSDKVMQGDEEKFFLAWGRAWRTHMRKEAQIQRILTDPHSPAICRVNGVVKNIPAFYEVFNIKPDDPLYLAPEKRAAIW